MPEPSKYPALPGSDSTPGQTAPAAPAKPATPAAQPANRPPAKPERVLNTLPTLGNLNGAALPVAEQQKQPVAAKAPEPVPAKRDVPSAPVKTPPPAQQRGGLGSVRKAVEELPSRQQPLGSFSSAPDEFAPGKHGGIARWDNLRDQLRKEHRLADDDPLFALVKVLEEMEVGFISYLRKMSETCDELTGPLNDAADLLDGVRDKQEQGTNLLAELTPTVENRLVPLLEKVLARLDEEAERRETGAKAASPGLSVPVLGAVEPPQPGLAPRPEGLWRRTLRVFGQVRE